MVQGLDQSSSGACRARARNRLIRIMWLCSPTPPHATCPRHALLVSGAAWWYWLGGRPAVDLVNTLRERRCGASRRLSRPTTRPVARARAARACGATREPRARARPATCAGDRRMHAGGARAAGADRGGRHHRRLAGARSARTQLELTDDGTLSSAARADRPGQARARRGGVFDAARMLGTPAGAARIRVCASATYSARFYDRWPAAAGAGARALCGKRGKARRHRDRSRIPPRDPHYRWVILATGAVGAGAFSALRMGPRPRPRCAGFGLSLGESVSPSRRRHWRRDAHPRAMGALTDRIGGARSQRTRRLPLPSSVKRRSRRPTRRCLLVVAGIPVERDRASGRAVAWAGSRAPSAASPSASVRWRCRSAAPRRR
jgi:hypothetical protein